MINDEVGKIIAIFILSFALSILGCFIAYNKGFVAGQNYQIHKYAENGSIIIKSQDNKIKQLEMALKIHAQ